MLCGAVAWVSASARALWVCVCRFVVPFDRRDDRRVGLIDGVCPRVASSDFTLITAHKSPLVVNNCIVVVKLSDCCSRPKSESSAASSGESGCTPTGSFRVLCEPCRESLLAGCPCSKNISQREDPAPPATEFRIPSESRQPDTSCR